MRLNGDDGGSAVNDNDGYYFEGEGKGADTEDDDADKADVAS